MSFVSDTRDFATKILRIEINEPGLFSGLNLERTRAKAEHIAEELDEIENSTSLYDHADGYIDILYITFGALAEMGFTDAQVKAMWDEVHAANMRKVNGSLAKRPNAGAHDAVKPEGWKGPDLKTALEQSLPPKGTGAEIVQDRAELYGSFKERAEVVEGILKAMESHPNWRKLLQAEHQHALRMIAEKIGRIVVGNNPYYSDNWKDIAGYAHLAEKGQ